MFYRLTEPKRKHKFIFSPSHHTKQPKHFDCMFFLPSQVLFFSQGQTSSSSLFTHLLSLITIYSFFFFSKHFRYESFDDTFNQIFDQHFDKIFDQHFDQTFDNFTIQIIVVYFTNLCFHVFI